jgi:hypothetical protein
MGAPPGVGFWAQWGWVGFLGVMLGHGLYHSSTEGVAGGRLTLGVSGVESAGWWVSTSVKILF